MKINPVGYVKSTVIEEKDQDWGETVSEIHLDAKLSPGLKGLEAFSHSIIIFYMHKATVNLETDLVRQPQGRSDMPYVGIFAQRAKHRPNPIGITTVEIISVEEGILTVKGLDAINDTPVIDIKPYFPIFDKANAYTPEWVNELMKTYF
ncbi:MAG: tRNA (N6-threonylcarbamoyladenosine(37)-N6)-methyltransferase TrmO [Candidatus Hodarchaeales archaeon]|jgi:tRNA-Thr(GGU) m(6)t(6)A37 methyltransferase TsaA